MKVFLSHSLADREWAGEFADALTSAGVDVTFWNSSANGSGKKIEEAFRNSIESSDLIVPILTEQSVRSPGVLFEVGYAKAIRKRVAPVIVMRDGHAPVIPGDLRSEFIIRAESPQKAAELLKRRAPKKKVAA